MKYRKKPVVIDAIQWTGENEAEICMFANLAVVGSSENISIKTLEGFMYANKGDWIIKGVKGEFYPCKPDIFDLTYEKVTKEKP